MAFSIYEVVRVTCQSRSWFVYTLREKGRKQTNYRTGKPRKSWKYEAQSNFQVILLLKQNDFRKRN